MIIKLSLTVVTARGQSSQPTLEKAEVVVSVKTGSRKTWIFPRRKKNIKAAQRRPFIYDIVILCQLQCIEFGSFSIFFSMISPLAKSRKPPQKKQWANVHAIFLLVVYVQCSSVFFSARQSPYMLQQRVLFNIWYFFREKEIKASCREWRVPFHLISFSWI